MQATLLNTLAESDAAVVFSDRARLELDTAVGYLPAESNPLQASSIYAVAHGANVAPTFPNKEEKKVLLGLKGKTVLLTLGYQGPDKVCGLLCRACNICISRSTQLDLHSYGAGFSCYAAGFTVMLPDP
jgi:hypothetical protein